MNEVVQSYVSKKQFMGCALVARGDTVLFDKCYGSANLEWNIPNSPETKFRIASLTKQFTAVSILLLENRGKLKVDDPVKKYMPDAPAAWDKVTIFHLLTHTSGIPSFTGFPDYGSAQAIATTSEKLVLRFRDKPLEFQPGESWHYNNSGYVLLGYLIEKISGLTYSEFVQQNIFGPLRMTHSGCDSNSAILPHRASGYAQGKQGIINAALIDMTIPFSAGGLYSTTEDLLRWEQALFGGSLLSSAAMHQMTTPFQHDYAFGLTVSELNGHRLIEHDGGIDGFSSELAYYPDTKLTVVILSNLESEAPGDIARQLAILGHGEKLVPNALKNEVAVPIAILEKYVGVYRISPNFDIEITLEDGNLMEKETAQAKIRLFAETDTRFFLKVRESGLEFFKNPDGEVTHLILRQGQRDRKGIRR